eukprot:4012153-Prymnesium_polylepis.1
MARYTSHPQRQAEPARARSQHPSRVVNYNPSGAGGVESSARTSESCKLPLSSSKIVLRVVQV